MRDISERAGDGVTISPSEIRWLVRFSRSAETKPLHFQVWYDSVVTRPEDGRVRFSEHD
jgi:hypothetical protein